MSGPSGAGKGTICELLREKLPEIKISISKTTRLPRGTEKDGVEYFFVDTKTFEQDIENNQFMEYAKVHTSYYGTPKSYVEELLSQGYDVILEIDVQGALQVQKNTTEGIFVFIAPPSMEELRNRIVKRQTDSPEQIEIRMKNAKDEMLTAQSYDYLVINEDKEETTKQVVDIITAEKLKVKRQEAKIKFIMGEKQDGI